MSYNFDLDILNDKYTIKIDTHAKYGYFEHNIFGEDRSGGLWFDDQNMLTDYDGVTELPKPVLYALIKTNRIYPDEITSKHWE
jgi:hypothetical protein